MNALIREVRDALAAARNPATPEDLIAEILFHYCHVPAILIALAHNSATPSDQLRLLSRNPDPRIRSTATERLRPLHMPAP